MEALLSTSAGEATEEWSGIESCDTDSMQSINELSSLAAAAALCLHYVQYSVAIMYHVFAHYGWRRGSMVRTSVYGRWTFSALRQIYG